MQKLVDDFEDYLSLRMIALNTKKTKCCYNELMEVRKEFLKIVTYHNKIDKMFGGNSR